MQLAIAMPQLVPERGFDRDGFAAYLARAEALGFESAWVQEHLLGPAPVLDPLALLAYAASATRELRLGCAVFVSALRSPVHLAAALATVDQLSGGRLEVGLGVGGKDGLEAYGVAPEDVVPRFSEGIRLMKALWRDDHVDFQGRFWQVDADVQPKPVQRPWPTLWIGAHAPAALRRAVRVADGFFGAGSATTARFADEVRSVREALAAQERDPATFRIAKRVYLALDDDAARARAAIEADLTHLYGSAGLGKVAVAGTVDDVVAGLEEIRAAGAERLLLNPLRDEPEQLERLAAEVLPRLA